MQLEMAYVCLCRTPCRCFVE